MMRVKGDRKGEYTLKRTMDRGTLQQIFSTGNKTHPLPCIIYHHSEMVAGRCIFSGENHIVTDRWHAPLHPTTSDILPQGTTDKILHTSHIDAPCMRNTSDEFLFHDVLR